MILFSSSCSYSSVNVQCCYNEFVTLRREFENEFHRNRKNSNPTTIIPSNTEQIKNTTEQLESTTIDNEEKTDDQLPDYSSYDDDVNASILKVLKNEEDVDERTTTNQEEQVIWITFFLN